MYFGRSTQDLGDVSNPRLTVSLFITLSQTMLHNLPRSGCYDDFQRTIFGKHVRIQRFSDARKKVPSWHKRPGQLLCTYIRILWLKRCVQFAAGHPLLLRLTRRSHPAIWSSPARVIHLDVIQQESQHRLRQKWLL